jgi:hypothetical protein
VQRRPHVDEARVARGVLALVARREVHVAREHGVVAEPAALAFHEAGYCCLQQARAAQVGNAAEASRYAGLVRAARERMAVPA